MKKAAMIFDLSVMLVMDKDQRAKTRFHIETTNEAMGCYIEAESDNFLKVRKWTIDEKKIWKDDEATLLVKDRIVSIKINSNNWVNWEVIEPNNNEKD